METSSKPVIRAAYVRDRLFGDHGVYGKFLKQSLFYSPPG